MAGHTHSLTYLSTLYVSTIVLLVLIPMYMKPTCQEPTETTRHCWGPKWGDVTKCRADIWQHVANMLANMTFGPQNCRHRHPTCATKLTGGRTDQIKKLHATDVCDSTIMAHPATDSRHIHLESRHTHLEAFFLDKLEIDFLNSKGGICPSQ